MRQRTVLITGCFKGGLGDAIARALHQRGLRVIATARNPAKMAHFREQGIETLTLDVLSPASISMCVAAVAEKTGGGCVTQIVRAEPFVPLLLKSEHGAIIANNTSLASVVPMPMGGIYNARKAATAMLTDNLRLELSPFNIKVVDLKTGAVKTPFFNNQIGGAKPSVRVEGRGSRVSRSEGLHYMLR
ncbi:hypothetical protein V1515DRAFT_624193 [Lipomyces mesembrius]